MKFPPVVFCAVIGSCVSLADCLAQTPPRLSRSASRKVTARDPSTIIKDGRYYWTFYTGRGTPSLYSRDLVKWEKGPRVFEKPPEWIASAVPENDGIYWAPDIFKVGDEYHLYYSVSTLGAQTSAIGLATNATLDPTDRDFKWKDQGMVIQTSPQNDFNAIDPSIFQDDDGSLWMILGSYWSGIKLVQLDPKTGKLLDPDAKPVALAHNESIEAAYLARHDGYYYLFVNWGSCCRGEKSTYEIRVGRSKSIEGPYLDREGTSLMHSGGSVFLENRNEPLVGPGHAGIVVKDGREWLSCHFEGDLDMEGKATLGVMPLTWTEDGWPKAELPEREKKN